MGSCLAGESRSPRASSPSFGVKKRKKIMKRASRSSSFNSHKEEHLHRVPGRMFLNGSSEVASLYTQQGKKGTNQDTMIVWENFGSRTYTVFCGVFDGHGPYGHMVAKRVRDSLPLKLRELNTSDSNDVLPVNKASDRTFLDPEVNKNPEKLLALKDLFLNAYKVMDRELRMHTNIDCFCSGSTAVTLIKQIWDVLTNNDVVDIVASAESSSCAARTLVESAGHAWKYKYPTSKVDDCAVVCLFLSPHPNTVSAADSVDKNEPIVKPSGMIRISERLPGEGTDADDDSVDDDLDEDPATTNDGVGRNCSALEGVSRANTLLNLPQFVPEEPEKQTDGEKTTN